MKDRLAEQGITTFEAALVAIDPYATQDSEVFFGLINQVQQRFETEVESHLKSLTRSRNGFRDLSGHEKFSKLLALRWSQHFNINSQGSTELEEMIKVGWYNYRLWETIQEGIEQGKHLKQDIRASAGFRDAHDEICAFILNNKRSEE